MTKTVTLKKVGYYVSGTADLTMWGGGNASISMKPFTTQSKNKSVLKRLINDNGFGVESINGAICDVYELFEGGYKEFLEEITVGEVSDDTVENHYLK